MNRVSTTVNSWYDHVGLSSDDLVENIPRYEGGQLRGEPPEAVDDVLPKTSFREDILFSKLPRTEYILLALDFQELCMSRVGRHPDGKEYRYKPLTEIAFTSLDMRNVIHKAGQNIRPGDRGSSWFKLMTPIHYRIEEYQDHRGHLCQSDALHAQSYSFAFGKSKALREADIALRLQDIFTALQKSNRTDKEKANRSNRQLIFLTFGSEMVETTLTRLGLSWLTQPNVKIWDVQRDWELELRFDWPKMKFEHVMEILGVRFEDTRFGSITSCAGNASVFLIQVFLALFYKNEAQCVAFAAREPVPWLPFTWVGHTLDQANIAPGETPQRRTDDQLNDSNVPQRVNQDVFRSL